MVLAGQFKDAHVVAGLAGGGHQFQNVGRSFLQAAQHGTEHRCRLKVVIRNQKLGVAAQSRCPISRFLGRFHFNVHCLRAGLDCTFQKIKLLSDAPLEPPAVRVSPAGCEQHDIRITVPQATYHPDGFGRLFEHVHPDFHKFLARIARFHREFLKLVTFRAAERHADRREITSIGHFRGSEMGRIAQATGRPAASAAIPTYYI